jgi:hypothetical protein
VPAFLKDDRVWNRHRAAFDASPNGFFREVHIAPVDNGSLLCAALYLRRKLRISSFSTPAALLEEMVVGNVGKFSIAGNRNVDYAGDPARVAESLPYFRLDLEALRPQLLILPRGMFRHRVVQDLVRESAPECRVIAVPQFNPGVVNRSLAKHARRAKELARELVGTRIARWTDGLTGYRLGYPYRYYAELEGILAKARGTMRRH